MSELNQPKKNEAFVEEENNENEMASEQNDQSRQIIETGTVTPTGGRHVIHCLTIVGQIEGHYILPPQNKTTKYEHVIPQLVAIQENPEIKGLLIILNTVGGDVEAGLAIAELISGMNKPTVSLVLGGGHSIGVPLAVSARKSFIAPSATMTIHPVRMSGVVLGVPQTLSYFDKMQERIVNFVEHNSNISPKVFRKLMMNTEELVMDVGSVLDGEKAVEEGLIDYLGGLSDAIDCLYDMIDAEMKNKETSAPPPTRRYEKVKQKELSENTPLKRKSPERMRATVRTAAALVRPKVHGYENSSNTDLNTLYQRIQQENLLANHTAQMYKFGGEQNNVNSFSYPPTNAD